MLCQCNIHSMHACITMCASVSHVCVSILYTLHISILHLLLRASCYSSLTHSRPGTVLGRWCWGHTLRGGEQCPGSVPSTTHSCAHRLPQCDCPALRGPSHLGCSTYLQMKKAVLTHLEISASLPQSTSGQREYVWSGQRSQAESFPQDQGSVQGVHSLITCAVLGTHASSHWTGQTAVVGGSQVSGNHGLHLRGHMVCTHAYAQAQRFTIHTTYTQAEVHTYTWHAHMHRGAHVHTVHTCTGRGAHVHTAHTHTVHRPCSTSLLQSHRSLTTCSRAQGP